MTNKVIRIFTQIFAPWVSDVSSYTRTRNVTTSQRHTYRQQRKLHVVLITKAEILHRERSHFEMSVHADLEVQHSSSTVTVTRHSPCLRLSTTILQFAKAGKSPALILRVILPAAWKTDTKNNALHNHLSSAPMMNDFHDTHVLWLIPPL